MNTTITNKTETEPINKTEEEIEHDRRFDEWNASQPEKFRIINRAPFTRVLPELRILDRVSKTVDTLDKEGRPAKEEMGFCPIKAHYPNGREVGLSIDIPTVIARSGFKTTVSKTGKKTISIPLVLYRSNPDHRRFLDLMVDIQNQAVDYIIANPKTMKGGSREQRDIRNKFSKLFYFAKDKDGYDLTMEQSEEVYMYLNPLDYVDKEKGVTNLMKILFPIHKKDESGKELNAWEELSWADVLDKDIALEITPKIIIQKIHHGAQYSLTVKCVSFVITNFFPIEKSASQEIVLRSIQENQQNKDAILEKFAVLKSMTTSNSTGPTPLNKFVGSDNSILVSAPQPTSPETNNIISDSSNQLGQLSQSGQSIQHNSPKQLDNITIPEPLASGITIQAPLLQSDMQTYSQTPSFQTPTPISNHFGIPSNSQTIPQVNNSAPYGSFADFKTASNSANSIFPQNIQSTSQIGSSQFAQQVQQQPNYSRLNTDSI